MQSKVGWQAKKQDLERARGGKALSGAGYGGAAMMIALPPHAPAAALFLPRQHRGSHYAAVHRAPLSAGGGRGVRQAASRRGVRPGGQESTASHTRGDLTLRSFLGPRGAA